MIVLYIILAILLILFSLLFIPVNIYFDLLAKFMPQDESSEKVFRFNFTLKWLFIKKSITSEKEAKQEQPADDKPAEPESDKDKPEKSKNSLLDKLKTIISNRSVSEISDLIKKLFVLLKDLFVNILKHTKISNLNFNLCLVGSDAYQTALYYGKACGLVYPVLTYLKHYPKIFVNPEMNVYSGFLSAQSQTDFSVKIRVIPFFLIKNVLIFLLKALMLLKNKK